MSEKKFVKSQRIRLFNTEDQWIAYHGLNMRPMAVGKDVVKVLECFNLPRSLPQSAQGEESLKRLGLELQNRSFIIPYGTKELDDWIQANLPDEHLKVPTRVILDRWQDFSACGQIVLNTISQFVDKISNPFAVVIREGNEPLKWDTLADFLDYQADHYPQFDWLMFFVITSGIGLNSAIIRRFLPYNIGFRIDVSDGGLGSALEESKLLIVGRAKVVLKLDLQDLADENLDDITLAGVTHVIGELPDGQAARMADSDSELVDQICGLQSRLAGADLRMTGFWDGPIGNFRNGNLPQRMSGRLRIDSDTHVHLEGMDLGQADRIRPEVVEKALENMRFNLEVQQCHDCPILGICPGPNVLRPEIGVGVRCKIAISIFERYLNSLLNRV